MSTRQNILITLFKNQSHLSLKYLPKKLVETNHELLTLQDVNDLKSIKILKNLNSKLFIVADILKFLKGAIANTKWYN